jgi:putative lipoic acid-binding regulatory protein
LIFKKPSRVVNRGGSFFMDEEWMISFREKLDQHYAWPSLYIFKFIVPAGKEVQVKNLFPLHTTTEKQSKQGNYTSITIQMMMPSSEAVINIYMQAAGIEGLIAL